MRKFYRFYSAGSVQQAVGLNITGKLTDASGASDTGTSDLQPVGSEELIFGIPWGHHVTLLDRARSIEEALFYTRQTLENNWSRSVLLLQMEQDLFSRHGKAITNFHQTLPEKQALMAGQILKDPYIFAFLTLEPKAQELDVERQLTEHITKFLLELGKGFAFVGRQYPLQVGDKDYRLDLLFYHIRLRCFVVIELKTVAFEPEFAGKMNFYLSVLDDRLKNPGDERSIGIILCKNKNKLEVEYALRGMNQPIGVSDFMITRALPSELKSKLPTVEEFEKELG